MSRSGARFASAFSSVAIAGCVGRVGPLRDHAVDQRNPIVGPAALKELARLVQILIELDEPLRIVRVRVDRARGSAAGHIAQRLERRDRLGRLLAGTVGRRDVVGTKQVGQDLQSIALGGCEVLFFPGIRAKVV